MNDSKTDDVSILAGKVVSVTTGTRLHFGLLSTAPPFGGIGAMIDQPQTEVVIRPATSFRCAQQVSDRIMPIAQRIRRLTDQAELPACHVLITKQADAHCGLGSGTQLAMAAAEGLASFCGLSLSREQLACQIATRGKRSAVGVHGYFSGGLIYEDAGQPSDLNPCRDRRSLADGWRIGLFQPSSVTAPVSGQLEQSHFQSLRKTPAAKRQRLADLITKEIMPAAEREDFAAFADAVHRYNLQSGLLFQDVQGGPYNGPQVSQLIQLLQRCGAAGVGQSSWGPTVFAWFENAGQASVFQRELPENVKTVAIAKPLNRGRDRSLSKCPQ